MTKKALQKRVENLEWQVHDLAVRLALVETEQKQMIWNCLGPDPLSSDSASEDSFVFTEDNRIDLPVRTNATP